MSKTRILFLCTHNSAGSQMAEGLLRHLYGDKFEVFSAGTNPTQVHPLAIKAMGEIGIDISKQYSKNIHDFKDAEIDLAVSVCRSSANITCALCSPPTVMGRREVVNAALQRTKHYLQHGFEDPSEATDTEEEERLAAFRRVRDEIKNWITEEFADLKNRRPKEQLLSG